MATTVTIYDLDNYPANSKTMTVDQKKVVATGDLGDEKWVLSFATTAYSDNTNTTSIQDIYVRDIKAGWLKSSGFVGTGGKFTIDATHKNLEIALDASVGPDGGTGYYPFTLEEGVNLPGETVADDMETKIRALAATLSTNDTGFELAYTNAVVSFVNGRFFVKSGTVSEHYTGTDRSSVKIVDGVTNGCYALLGFDLAIDSQTIASTAIKESLLTSNYTGGTATLYIDAGTTVVSGECMLITDGSNTEYFTVLGVATDTDITVATNATNGYSGISNSYTSGVTKVQLLREQDPEQEPVPCYNTIDDITRWGILSVVNQVDFSS